MHIDNHDKFNKSAPSLSDDAMKQTPIRGLKDRLREAESSAEIDELLAEGDGYEFTDAVTRRKWKREATRRRAELKEEQC